VTLKLRWTEQAVEQLGAIADYISLTSPVYAEGVVGRIAARITLAQQFPDIGRAVPEHNVSNARELVEWPYRIVYRRRAEFIEILAIIHVRRDFTGPDPRDPSPTG
jgi:plasmid stabilization system protein ParE